MTTETLKSQFETLGFPLANFKETQLQLKPLNKIDFEVLIQCGFPKVTAPDYIHFVSGVFPEEGHVLQSLSQMQEKYRGNKMAEACIVFAKDSMGNLFWINTAANHQITFHDRDYAVNRFVNSSLTQFLACILLYNAFIKKYGSGLERFLFQTKTNQEKIELLKQQMIASDSKAFENPENYWLQVGFDGI